MSAAKKKSCPTAATAEQQEDRKTCRGNSSSGFDDTTTAGERQGVSAFLCYGESNAIPGRDLVKLLGLHDLRELTQMIEKARRNGVPICASCSDPRGYYIAETPEELERYLRSLDRRLSNIRATRSACGDTLRRMNGQEEVEGW